MRHEDTARCGNGGIGRAFNGRFASGSSSVGALHPDGQPNFTGKTRFRGSTDRLHLVERFTRVGPDTINYEFTVTGPATWTKPWTAAFEITRVEEEIYEYACHEGNHGLRGVLARARATEKARATASRTEPR